MRNTKDLASRVVLEIQQALNALYVQSDGETPNIRIIDIAHPDVVDRVAAALDGQPVEQAVAPGVAQIILQGGVLAGAATANDVANDEVADFHSAVKTYLAEVREVTR